MKGYSLIVQISSKYIGSNYIMHKHLTRLDAAYWEYKITLKERSEGSERVKLMTDS